MMMQSYFSVSFEMIPTDRRVPYSLYINSSSLENKERFVRVFRKDETLTKDDLRHFAEKYRRIYVAESERSLFVRSLCAAHGASPKAKTEIIKDSAIQHLRTLFEHECTTEVLSKTLVDCRDVVEGMIDVLDEYDDIDKLRDLIANLSFHDFYTYDHSINVAMYCILIYRLLYPKATRQQIIQAGMGGLLHDLGKIRISNKILNKTDKLTDEEFAEIKRHPGFGCELIETTKSHLPKDIDVDLVTRIVFEHHENFDGTGYPKGTQKDQIHLLSRITAIADFFDAITTKRSYHEPLSPEEAIALMSKSEGKKIDPDLFNLFTDHIRNVKPGLVLKRELPSDFDPCQPHKELPFIASKPGVAATAGGKGYGGIRVLVETEDDRKAIQNSDHVKVIDPKTLTQVKKSAAKKKVA